MIDAEPAVGVIRIKLISGRSIDSSLVSSSDFSKKKLRVDGWRRAQEDLFS